MLARRVSIVLTCLLSLSNVALAQDNVAAGPPDPATTTSAPPPAEGGTDPNAPAQEEPAVRTANDTQLTDEQALQEEQHGAASAAGRSSSDPYEDPQTGYWFLGAFYRQTIIPAFMQRLFVDGGATASNPAGGLELTFRKDNFDITASLWWANFHFSGPYRGSGDPDTDTEIVHSDNLGALFASASFLWSTPFNDIVSLQYGLDVGVGVVFGDVIRNEAYPLNYPTTGAPYGTCIGPGSPATAGYCGPGMARDGERGEHYNVTARKWTDGGNVPNVIPWLAIPHLALRIKPIKQLMFRIDAGFGLGFFFGGAVNYGF